MLAAGGASCVGTRLTRPPAPAPPRPRSYGPVLDVLAVLQGEGFLRFHTHDGKGTAHTLVYSLVAGEGAHNIPKPRQSREGINSFSLQFLRRLLLDAGFPLKAFVE